MGLFDALMRTSFDERDGRWIFYPHGLLSRGFILADDQKHVELRRFIKRYFLIAGGTVFLALITVGTWFVALAVLMLLWYELAVRRLTRGLPLATKRLALRDNLRAQARRHTLTDLWTLELVSLLLVAASGALIADPDARIVGVVAILIFAAIALVFGLMIREKRQQRG